MVHLRTISEFGKKESKIILLLICLSYLINGICYLKSQSITSDEGAFYNYAKRMVKGNPNRVDRMIDDSKTPIVIVNLIPRIAEQIIHPTEHKTDWGAEDIIRGRYITMIVSVLVILLVYLWAQQLYGVCAGLFAAFLISMSPNNIALAGLVTTDAYSVLFLLLVFYCMWRMLYIRSFKYFIFFCLAEGIAQLVKPSLFHLYILMPLTLLVYFFMTGTAIKLSGILKYLIIFLFFQWLIINLGYYFYGTNRLLGDYHFISHSFQSVQKILPSRLPVPLPEPFLEELDMSGYNDQLGGGYYESSFGKITILGRSSVGGSFWYYYLVSIIFKTPITYIVLLCWAVLAGSKNPVIKKRGWHILFLVMPVLYFLFIFSFLYKTQIGIRHIIFLYPFICILCSSLIPVINSVYKKRAILFLSIYLVISVLYYWRNYYPYTNEFIWNKTFAYKWVGASNLEFHQGAYFEAEYLLRHPNVKPVGSSPDTGEFIIRVDDYLDLFGNHSHDWISSIKPRSQVAFDYLLIRVEPSDLIKSKIIQ